MTCRGVWLDRGELDKILVKERRAGCRRPERRRDEKRYKTKRRSFLEDLLDFD